MMMIGMAARHALHEIERQECFPHWMFADPERKPVRPKNTELEYGICRTANVQSQFLSP